MISSLALFIRIPVMWFSTNSITGAGSRFSGRTSNNKEIQSIEETIRILDQKIKELKKEKKAANELLAFMRKENKKDET